MSLLSPTGALTKMFLLAYDSNEHGLQKVSVGDSDRFVFQVNPEGYQRRLGLQYSNTARTPGTTGDAGSFNNAEPETFTVDILFDNTGIITGESLLNIAIVNPFSSDEPADVTARIETLKQFCYYYQGNIHRPYYIRLCWGDESGFFFGVVTTLEIDYKLFRPDGKPIRAVAHLSLNAAEDPRLTTLRNAPSSPDITHDKVFKAGDRFSHMAEKVYGDDRYYTDVARANGLVSFRNIKEGTVLRFPPLK